MLKSSSLKSVRFDEVLATACNAKGNEKPQKTALCFLKTLGPGLAPDDDPSGIGYHQCIHDCQAGGARRLSGFWRHAKPAFASCLGLRRRIAAACVHGAWRLALRFSNCESENGVTTKESMCQGQINLAFKPIRID
jgi:hypothetical protein